MFRGRGLVALSAAAGLAVAAFGAAPADAHPDTSAEAASLCGPGFHVADDPDGTPARRSVKTDAGVVFGHVYLTYNPSSGRNCVVAIKSRFHGQATFMLAGIQVQGRTGPCGDGYFCDFGMFEHFAGGPPDDNSTVNAAGRCVRYWAVITDGAILSATRAEGGRKRWGNCG